MINDNTVAAAPPQSPRPTTVNDLSPITNWPSSQLWSSHFESLRSTFHDYEEDRRLLLTEYQSICKVVLVVIEIRSSK